MYLATGLRNTIQLIVNYFKYDNLLTAARCIDFKDVALSAGFGALGASPLKALKGSKGLAGAIGVAGITTWTKKITVPSPIRIGDECECSGGRGNGGIKGTLLDLLGAQQL